MLSPTLVSLLVLVHYLNLDFEYFQTQLDSFLGTDVTCNQQDILLSDSVFSLSLSSAGKGTIPDRYFLKQLI